MFLQVGPAHAKSGGHNREHKLFRRVYGNESINIINRITTSHEGFFTRDALTNIARTTIGNISAVDFSQLRQTPSLECP